MKAIKGLVLFCFLAIGVSSCFDPPDFKTGLEIKFRDIEFKKGATLTDADSLIVHIDFKDGDGDIGFDQSDIFRNDPYHVDNFYFADVNAIKAVSIGTVQKEITLPPLNPGGQPRKVKVPTIVTTTPAGKLISKRTRENIPQFGFLPVFDNNKLNCKDYTTSLLLVSEPAKSSIDNSYNVTDTITIDGLTHYLVEDTLYFSRNPHHHNARVRIYQNSGTGFTEFVWEDVYCATLNARLPVLTDRKQTLEGTIRWSIRSVGLESTFSIKILKLDIIIEDRALNKDSIRTPEFTLQQIRVN